MSIILFYKVMIFVNSQNHKITAVKRTELVNNRMSHTVPTG